MKPNPVTLKEFKQWKKDKKPVAFIVDAYLDRGMDECLRAYLLERYLETNAEKELRKN